MNFEEFNRRKQLLNLFPNQTLDSDNIYNEMKIIKSQEYNIMVQSEEENNLLLLGGVIVNLIMISFI